jgi:hypothetical protein
VFNPAYFRSQYFPPVWFAPGDETAVPPEELKPQGGGTPVKVKAKTKTRPAWVVPAQFIQIDRAPIEDDEALLLCGAL